MKSYLLVPHRLVCAKRWFVSSGHTAPGVLFPRNQIYPKKYSNAMEGAFFYLPPQNENILDDLVGGITIIPTRSQACCIHIDRRTTIGLKRTSSVIALFLSLPQIHTHDALWTFHHVCNRHSKPEDVTLEYPIEKNTTKMVVPYSRCLSPSLTAGATAAVRLIFIENLPDARKC